MLANEWEKVQPVLTFSDNVNIITVKNKEGILRQGAADDAYSRPTV